MLLFHACQQENYLNENRACLLGSMDRTEREPNLIPLASVTPGGQQGRIPQIKKHIFRFSILFNLLFS